ncbi:MAG: hypothetical protein ACREQN_01945 [Candidatus Binataceae bacterium]
MERAKRRRNERKADDDKQKLEALVERVVRTATQGAEAIGLEFDAVYANGDDFGFAVVINFNLKDIELDDGEKENLFLERLGTLLEEQLESLEPDEPSEPEQ